MTVITPNSPSLPPATTSQINYQAIMLPAVLVLIVAFFAICSPGHVFISSQNLTYLAIELSVTAVLALGMLLVILPGHVDLSAGSGVGLLGAIAAVLVMPRDYLPSKLVAFVLDHFGEHARRILVDPWPAWCAMLVAIVLGIVIWWAMGTFIVREKLPAFIITLSGLLIFKGIHWWVIRSNTIPVVKGGEHNLYSLLTTYYFSPTLSLLLTGVIVAAMALAAFSSYQASKGIGLPVDGELTFIRTFVIAQVMFLFVLVCNSYRGVPLPAVVLGAVALAVHVLTRHTPYGRYLYAIGGNEEAAVVSGLPVARVVITAFAIMGFLTAITGLLQTAYAGSSTTTVGQLMELDAVAACVIGGVSLKGGRGTVVGVLLGSMIMAALLNGMVLMEYGPEKKYFVRGVVLALAVWADTRLGRRS